MDKGGVKAERGYPGPTWGLKSAEGVFHNMNVLSDAPSTLSRQYYIYKLHDSKL